MGCAFNFFFLTALLTLSFKSSAMAARPLTPASTLAARLKLEEGSSNCWDSLLQLQACTGEVIMFFLNGETYLGSHCCQAIRTIGNQCWPGMIGALGFSSEEGDILQGYCDAADHSPPSSESLKPNNIVIPVKRLAP